MSNNIFKAMNNKVNKHVKYYKTDLKYDINCIKKHGEGIYYWLLRECGTAIITEKEIQYMETSIYFTYWLNENVKLYRIQITDNKQENIYPITKKQINNILGKRINIPSDIVIDYLLSDIKNRSEITDIVKCIYSYYNSYEILQNIINIDHVYKQKSIKDITEYLLYIKEACINEKIRQAN
jgi:hypothetical protein